MKTIRTAFVCADPGVPVFGRKGCSIHVQEVIRALRHQDVAVELFAARLDDTPPGDLQDLRTHALPCPKGGDLAGREQACQAANALLAEKLDAAGPFDLVYERYSLWSHAGMEWARRHGVPGLLEVNAPLVEEQAAHRGLVDRAAAIATEAAVFSAASDVIAVSDEVATHVRRRVPALTHVHVVANGVNPERFRPGGTPAWCWPEAGRPFVIGFVGTLKPWHGVTTLIDAFAAMHAAQRETRLLLVGDGPERDALEKQVSRHGLKPAVLFTGGVEARDIPGLLAGMDVCVAPYPQLNDFYFSPLKVYEYMAAGRPVVASAIGQLKDLIHHRENGLLCTPGEPGHLLGRLLTLHSDPELRARLGAAARQTILDGHTWDHVAASIAGIARDARPGPAEGLSCPPPSPRKSANLCAPSPTLPVGSATPRKQQGEVGRLDSWTGGPRP